MYPGDSVLLWHRHEATQPLGGVKLAHSPDLIAAGEGVARVPGTPAPPPGVTLAQVQVQEVARC